MATAAIFSFHENPNELEILDHRKLPLSESKVRLRTVEDVKKAIENMTVQGAVLIALCGAYGMALASAWNEDLDAAKRTLDSARPTSASLVHATSKFLEFAKKSSEKRSRIFDEVKKFIVQEVEAYAKIAELGSGLIPTHPREGEASVFVLQHGKSGDVLADGSYSSFGSIVKRWEVSPNLFVWVNETRPLLQGSRISAWELNNQRIPNKVIVDGASGLLMVSGRVDCVFFAAEEVAANGDVLSRIGTYPLCVVARENGVPVYCVASTSSINLSITNGAQIKIEERNHSEVLEHDGKRFVDEAAKAFNPAFDVTAYRFITAIVTEEDICYPPFRDTLVTAKARAIAKQKGLSQEEIPTIVENITELLAKTSVKKTADRIFPGQNEPVEERRPYRREDPRTVKHRTFLGDEGDEPNMSSKELPRVVAKKTSIGDDTAELEKSAPSVRIYNNSKKSSILLTDEAQPFSETKSSIRVTAKGKQPNLFSEEKPGHSSSVNKSPLKARDAAIAGSEKDLHTLAKGHIEHQPPSQEPPPSSKGHIDLSVKSSDIEKSTSKAHFSQPSPGESMPQSKGLVSPAKPSHVFG